MSKHIVGRKIETYLTGVCHDYGGHWIVTTHTIVNELHATKGWRTVMHDRTDRRRKKPTPGEWRRSNVTRWQREMPERHWVSGEYDHMYDPMRHPWQRKAKAWAMLRDLLPAENRLDVA